MLTLLVLLALSACTPAGDLSKSLQFELRTNDILVPVRVSGRGPFRFLLDTGASHSIVSQRVAALLPAGPRSTTLMMTPVGQAVRPTVDVTLAFGDRGRVPVRATVVEEDRLSNGGAGIDGIVGQDVLAPLVYTIDYQRRSIVWDGDTCATPGARLPLRIESGRALITVPLDGHLLQLIPDSGADGVVLHARQGRRLPALMPMDVALLRTLSGHRLVRRVLIDRLQLGSIDLRDHPAVVLEQRPEEPALSDGLLPLHLFSRVTFNGPAGYLAIER